MQKNTDEITCIFPKVKSYFTNELEPVFAKRYAPNTHVCLPLLKIGP